MDPRPKLIPERLRDEEITDDDDVYKFGVGNGQYMFPHCDSFVLHLAKECAYCRKAVTLQKDREEAGVSNTGHTNRPHPCPSTQMRKLETIHRWGGNTPAEEDDV